METSLHQQLKALYADDTERIEVKLGRFRIDAIVGDELIEIQHGSLAAIRDKIQTLVKDHDVRVVKPIVATKLLVKRQRKNGKILERRQSPKRGTLLDIFDELVYFRRTFPHPRLILEVPLVHVEEWRYPGHGRRRRRRERDHVVEDQKLIEVAETHMFSTARDLLRLLPKRLPRPFHTGHVAKKLGVARWIAQRMVYCLREMGGVEVVGKEGNAILYQRVRKANAKAA